MHFYRYPCQNGCMFTLYTYANAGLTYAVDFSPTNPHLLMVAERDMLVHLIDVQAHARQTTSYLRYSIIL